MSQTVTLKLSSAVYAVLRRRQEAMGRNLKRLKVTQTAAAEACFMASPDDDWWEAHYAEFIRSTQAGEDAALPAAPRPQLAQPDAAATPADSEPVTR